MLYMSFRCCFFSAAIPVATAIVSRVSEECSSDDLDSGSSDDLDSGPRFELCGEHDGVWSKGREAHEQSDSDMCQRGKVLPQLYLLGPPKGGTTSLSRDLTSAGVTCYTNHKEPKFWEKHLHKPESEVKTNFRSPLDSCSKTDRSVVADFSPSNIGFPGIPKLMRSVYGPLYENIKFVLMLREPLSRLQSHFYFGHTGKGAIFQQEVESLLQGRFFDSHSFGQYMNDISKASPIKQMAIYCKMGYHLETWLESFKAKQFMIIPYRSYVKNAADMKVCSGIAKHLDISIGCAPEISHAVSTPHPSLSQDVSPEVQKLFKLTLSDDTQKLAGLLELGAKEGMRIAYYEKGNASIWLDQNW